MSMGRKLGSVAMVATLICATLLLSGCGRPQRGPKTPRAAPVPFTGVVKYQGKPLADARVIFLPQSNEGGVGGVAVTDSEGRYDAKTVSEDGFLSAGISPGKYRVSFSKLVKPDGTPVPPESNEPPANMGARESLPVTIADPLLSNQLVQVPEAGGSFDFNLK